MAKKKGKGKQAEAPEQDAPAEDPAPETSEAPAESSSDFASEAEVAAAPDAAPPAEPEPAFTADGDDDPELATHSPLVLGADDADGDALDEFEKYESLDDEYPEDDQPADGSPPLAPLDPDDARLTPKERKLANMTLEARVEAIVFAAKEPLKAAELLPILADLTLTEADVQTALDNLVDYYEDRCGGFRLVYLKRLGYQFQTSDAAGAIMERMFASRPRPISRAALETLAIIAYRQPVTRAEVEFIRGVDAGSIFKTLLERDLIKCTGRKEIVGRPMLFGTTDNFLTVFNLSSIKDLPPLEAFQPSREVMQGAAEKLAGGDDLVDVEEYIADNTRGEYEGEGELPVGETADESDADVAERAEAGVSEALAEGELHVVTGAALAEPDTVDDLEDVSLPVPEESSPEMTREGATAAPDSPEPAEDGGFTESPTDDESADRSAASADAHPEVPVADGAGVPEGSGELDQ